jgi:phosphohistidine phosphatase
MKILYIVRHAKSSWDDSVNADFERPLNQRGFQDAALISQLLREKTKTPDLIISSPAKRAVTTANIFADKFQYTYEKIITDERIYEAGIKELISVTERLDNHFENVMMFGHNPGLTNFANFLSSKPIPHLPTCAIAGLKLNIDSWNKLDRFCGDVFLFEFPKNYK